MRPAAPGSPEPLRSAPMPAAAGSAAWTAALVLAFASPAQAQPGDSEESARQEAGAALEIAAFAGALRIDDDFALDAGGALDLGRRRAPRPPPHAPGHALRRGVVRLLPAGPGAFATLRPWIGRGWPADPALRLRGSSPSTGTTTRTAGPGFGSAWGSSARSAATAGPHAGVREHFLTPRRGGSGEVSPRAATPSSGRCGPASAARGGSLRPRRRPFRRRKRGWSSSATGRPSTTAKAAGRAWGATCR